MNPSLVRHESSRIQIGEITVNGTERPGSAVSFGQKQTSSRRIRQVDWNCQTLALCSQKPRRDASVY